jgi:histone-lysine N-methyltransferase SETMAR
VSVHGISSQRFTCENKIKTQVSAGKLMATVFWDVDGVIHMEFLEPGTTINPERYIATVKTLTQRLRRVRKHKKNILLQHYNARPHTSRTTMEEIEKLDLTILPHPPYSPDLAPCSFHLSPKMKKHLRGHLYDSNEEVERTFGTWMKKLRALTHEATMVAPPWSRCPVSKEL